MEKTQSGYLGQHPIHGAQTGHNFSLNINKNVWRCFNHYSGGGVLNWIAVQEGIIDCIEAQPGFLRGEKFKKTVEIAKKKYGLKTKINYKTEDKKPKPDELGEIIMNKFLILFK